MTRASAHSVLRGEFSASFDTACSAPTRKQPPGTAVLGVGRDRVLNHDRNIAAKGDFDRNNVMEISALPSGAEYEEESLSLYCVCPHDPFFRRAFSGVRISSLRPLRAFRRALQKVRRIQADPWRAWIPFKLG